MTVTTTGCKITQSVMAAGHNNVILETKSLTSFTCTAQAASEETVIRDAV